MKISLHLKNKLRDRVICNPSVGTIYPTNDLHRDIKLILEILDKITEI